MVKVDLSKMSSLLMKPPTKGGLKNFNDDCCKNKLSVPSGSNKNKSSSSDISPNNNPDFKTIKLISDIVLFCLKKCWMACGAAVFIIFVIYWYYGSLLALFLFIFSISGLLYQIGDWLLYHPEQPPHSRLFVPAPSTFGLPADNLHIKSQDGTRINVVLIKQDSNIMAQVPTILYLHGNAGNIGHRLPNVQGLYHFCGCNILLLEYRGFGHSEGSPSEEGIYQDTQAALQYLLQHPNIDHSKIVIFGRSLGGAVGIDLASRQEFSQHILCLVVENTFTSIPEVAKVLFNWKIVKWLPEWTFKNRYRSIEKISKVTVPILFISGQADILIPPQMMKALYQACGSSLKRLMTFESGTHNETWQCKNYYKTLNLFFDDVMMSSQDNLKNPHWPLEEVCIQGFGKTY